MRACLIVILFIAAAVHADPAAHYLGNEAVLIDAGDTRIVFDPLFNEDFDLYERVPDDIRRDLLAGRPPFDGIVAAFVSHYHDDHFDPATMLYYLEQQPGVRLFAPRQAVDAMLALARPEQAALFERIEAIELSTGDDPVAYAFGSLRIEAVRVPHAGWPARHPDVENIVYRVTLDDELTVSHFGDADPDPSHFDEDHWAKRRSRLALPPYWFLEPAERRDTLLPRLNSEQFVGIHVPKTMPDDPAQRPEALRDADLFTRPGETRALEQNTPDTIPKRD